MAINERVHILREAIVKITQLLAGKSVQVTQRGVSAFVRPDHTGKPVLVNLPYLPDNASDELVDAIQGFLDHEVAHILFTDFKLANTIDRNGDGSFWNVLEDTRIEREMANRFRGSAENLARTGQFFLDKYTTPKLKAALAAGDTEAVQGILAVPLIRAMAGQTAFGLFMKDYMGRPEIKAVYDKIKDLEGRIQTLSSTADALELSKEIVGRLRDGKPAPAAPPMTPPPAPKSASPSAGAKGKKKDDEDEGEGASAPAPTSGEEGKSDEEDDDVTAAPPPSAGKPEEKGDDEEEDNEEGAGEEEAPAAGDPEDEDEDGDEGEDDAGADDGLDDNGPPQAENNPDEEGGALINADELPEGEGSGDAIDTSKASAISWRAIDKETANDFDDTVVKAIADGAAEAAADADYLIYTKDKDVIEPLPVSSQFKPEMLTSLQDKVEHMVAPLQKDLERAIAARSLSHWSPGHRSGRLHAAALSRLAVNDPRVFRRKEETTSKDVAVELLVDASGSMMGAKMHTATGAAYALASVLERIGIKSEVICFTTGEAVADFGTLRKEADKIGREFSRYESLYMPILKGFDERMTTEVKNRFGWLPNSMIMANNVDGECVEIAARRLAARREKGKILMVLSDGAPHAGGYTRTLGPHLKKVVANVTKTGTKVIGIGIMSDAVRQFYPKHIILNDVKDLPTVVMKELRQLVIG